MNAIPFFSVLLNLSCQHDSVYLCTSKNLGLTLLPALGIYGHASMDTAKEVTSCCRAGFSDGLTKLSEIYEYSSVVHLDKIQE